MVSILKDDLQCSICLDFFVDPQMLDCGHNLCLTCVKSCIPPWRDMGKCPECRVPFKRHYYTSNRVLGNVAAKVRMLEADQESQSGTPTQHICKEHNEPVKLFCKRDLAPACVYCRNQPGHRRHVFMPINQSVEYAEEALKPFQTGMGNCLKKITKVQKKHQRKTVKMVTDTKAILSHISRDCEVFRQILQEKGKKLKENVEEMKAKNLEELRDALHSIQEVSSFTEMNTKIITESSSADNCTIHNFLQEKEENLKENVEEMKEKNKEVMKDALRSLQEEVSKDVEMKEKNMEVAQDALSSVQGEASKEDIEMEKNMDSLNSLEKDVKEVKETKLEVVQGILCSLQKVSSQTEKTVQFKTICAAANTFVSFETSTEEILSHISQKCMDFCKALHENELKLKEKVEEMETENVKKMQDVADASCLVPGKEDKSPPLKKKKVQIKTKCVAVDNCIFLKDFKDLIDRIKQIQPQLAKDKGLKSVRLVRKGGRKWKRGHLLHRGRGWRLGRHLHRKSGACRRVRLLKGGGGAESQESIQEKEGGEGTSQQL